MAQIYFPYGHELHVAIHDLHSRGGQDRSTLEILRRLAKKHRIVVHAFTLEDKDLPVLFRPVPLAGLRPMILKAVWFYLVLWLRENMARLRGSPPFLWQSTGVAHIRSQIVHVQFVHTAWRQVRAEHQIREWTWNLRGLHSWLFESANILLERFCFTKKKIYIPISEKVAEELRHGFGLRENIRVVPHGVDPVLFRPGEVQERQAERKAFGIAPDDVVGLFVGALERKGLDTVLEALALLPAELRANFKLLAIGSGDHAHFKKRAEDLGVSKNLILRPSQPGIQKIFWAADFFVLPTRYEPFGMVILEAMAAGLAVVVPQSAGASELLRNRRAGILLQDALDPREIAQAMERLLRDPVSRMALGREARAVAATRSWDIVADEYERAIFLPWHRGC